MNYAYTDTAIDYPDTESAPRPTSAGVVRRWALPAAALITAASALAASAAVGVRALDDAQTPIVSVSRPTITTRAPSLTQPDQDSAFLQDLDAHVQLADPAGVDIHNAHAVCLRISTQQQTREQIIAALLAAPAAAPGGQPSRGTVTQFVDIAIRHYCPDQAPR